MLCTVGSHITTLDTAWWGMALRKVLCASTAHFAHKLRSRNVCVWRFPVRHYTHGYRRWRPRHLKIIRCTQSRYESVDSTSSRNRNFLTPLGSTLEPVSMPTLPSWCAGNSWSWELLFPIPICSLLVFLIALDLHVSEIGHACLLWHEIVIIVDGVVVTLTLPWLWLLRSRNVNNTAPCYFPISVRRLKLFSTS